MTVVWPEGQSIVPLWSAQKETRDMGAWGYGPFDNDSAMEWIDNDIGTPVLNSIRSKLTYFIQEGFNDDVEKDKAMAAVALLVEFCHSPKTLAAASCPINLYFSAKEDDTFHLAITTVNLLLNDDTWINDWSYPEKKRQTLDDLLQRLRQLGTS
jgi:hypothetical protein